MRLLLLVVLSLFVSAYAAPSVPVWPSKYFVTGTFSIPYWDINESIVANMDAANQRQRFDYYGGLDTFLTLNGQGVSFEVVPRILSKVCFKQGTNPLVNLIPDMTGYSFQGYARVNGWLVENWQLTTVNFNSTGTYNLYVYRRNETSTPKPVRFVLQGVNTIFDSHPDVYIMDYNAYIPNFNEPDAFNIPALCNQENPFPRPSVSTFQRRLGYLARMFKPASPSAEVEEDPIAAKFEAHCQQYGKYYLHDPKEHARRLNIFKKNLRLIEQHNKKDVGYKLAMNHFGDMDDEEFKKIMLPKAPKPAIKSEYVKMDYEVLPRDAKLNAPNSIDWVKLGAVTMVKDQGACGSCWTFGTTGTLEGAWFVKTGQLLSLSEQQLVDCAWGYSWSGAGGNQGCDGGFASGALQWIIDNGGIATEANYPYIMQDAFCLSSDLSSGVQVQAYVNVTPTEDALKVAVANGPVAVAIDASHPEFRFYSSGVYYQADCKNDVDDLDHEVLAVGYGNYQGQDYWLVKNSWSTHWGNQGYVMMSRNRDNNCGIATQPNYPIV